MILHDMSKTDILTIVLSTWSFALYVLFEIISPFLDLSALPYTAINVILLLGILQHYIFTLGKIAFSPYTPGRKVIALLVVLVIGHFGSWAYFLYFRKFMYTASEETDKIDLRPLAANIERSARKTA